MALTRAGLNVVFDATITAGQDWRATLSDLMRPADAVVLVISAESVNSQWVMHEAGTVLGLFQVRGRPLLIPVIIDDVPLPPPVASIQGIIAVDRDVPRVAAEVQRAVSVFLGRVQAQKEQRREAQARIEGTAEAYIGEAIDQLRRRERWFQYVGIAWYAVAMSTLLIGLAFAVWLALYPEPGYTSWPDTARLAISTILVIGLLGALSRFAFVLGKSFMVEALRNGDRIHAISFGRFYLRAYGERAEWSEIKEAFQHWNIDIGSSFLGQTAQDIDPQVLNTAMEIAKAFAGKAKDKA